MFWTSALTRHRVASSRWLGNLEETEEKLNTLFHTFPLTEAVISLVSPESLLIQFTQQGLCVGQLSADAVQSPISTALHQRQLAKQKNGTSCGFSQASVRVETSPQNQDIPELFETFCVPKPTRSCSA